MTDTEYPTGRCIGITTKCKRCPNPAPEGDKKLCPAHQGMLDGSNHRLRTTESPPMDLLAWFAIHKPKHRGTCRALTNDRSRCTGWTYPHEPFCRDPHTREDDPHVERPRGDELDQVAIREAVAAISDTCKSAKYTGRRITFGQEVSSQSGLGAFAAEGGE